ncbi:MAG: hypothetical protein AAGG48_28365 [Planctomycetota bacterium]
MPQFTQSCFDGLTKLMEIHFAGHRAEHEHPCCWGRKEIPGEHGGQTSLSFRPGVDIGDGLGGD